MSAPRLHYGGTWSVVLKPSTGWDDDLAEPVAEYSVAVEDEGRPIRDGDHVIVTRRDSGETEVEIRDSLDAYSYRDHKGIERFMNRYRYKTVPFQQRLGHQPPKRRGASKTGILF